MSKKTSYVVLVGADADVVDAFFRAFSEQPDSNEVRVVSTLVTPTLTSRTLLRILDGVRLSVTDYTPMLGLDGETPPIGLNPTDRALLIQASGYDVEKLGSTIVDAVGLDPASVVPYMQLAMPEVLPTNNSGSLSDLVRLNPLVMFARWRTMSAKPPLLITHVAEHSDEQRAAGLFKSTVPAFVRPWVLTLTVGSHHREAINELLRTTTEDGEPVPTVPFRGACILTDATDPLDRNLNDAGAVAAIAKTPLVGRDARKLKRALAERMETFPNLALITASVKHDDTDGPGAPAQLTKPEPPETPTPPVVPSAHVEELTVELERARAALKVRDDTISGLRRELRTVHYQLDQATAAPPESEPAVQALVPEPAVPVAGSDGMDAEESDRLASLSPSSFDDVFGLTHEHLPLVALCDKMDAKIHELAGNAKTPVWAARTWAIMLSLQDFAAARASGSGGANLRSHMAALPHPLFPPNQISVNESKMTAGNSKMRKERTFPVPVEVDPSGWVVMESHVRVDSGGKYPAPRLYFFDDTKGATGQVHVGYVGPHLTNFLTN